ncbi:NAD(P)-binding protein [Zopfia rhizophila CBS 207.26]|uniref:NAD(P)-binding protein n=1 Tax=Zopfia rhizophila CBS 207.26 TaxID=1314779 RepID=A0A6A6EDV6_9PEZI|nr:NAD(P)-binding protein [Zopfia rhizophila CBS 207.26]
MASYRPSPPKLQEQDLKGKVAVVTGATKGIGRAIALDLATRGASVLGTYSSPESVHNFDTLSHTVNDLYPIPDTQPHLHVENAPRLHGVVADITSAASISQVILALGNEFDGKLDILVLNAVYNCRPRIGSISEQDISKALMGNLHWPIALMENFVRQKSFRENSRVVVISSDRVRDPTPGCSLFNACKTGLESLSRSWAVELPPLFPGTTVNAVSVGLTDTPGLRAFPAAAQETTKRTMIPKVKVVEGGRIGYAEDVADVVGFLVSQKSRWVTGSVVAANGGGQFIGGSS